MKIRINSKILTISLLCVVTLVAYMTDSPTIGAALCGLILGAYAGMTFTARKILDVLSEALPSDLLQAIFEGRKVETHVTEVENTEEVQDKIDEFLKSLDDKK